jgi:hypothetical protein
MRALLLLRDLDGLLIETRTCGPVQRVRDALANHVMSHVVNKRRKTKHNRLSCGKRNCAACKTYNGKAGT